MDNALARIRVGETANPYGLSDRTMEWVRAQAKRDIEASVARARLRQEACVSSGKSGGIGDGKEARLKIARAEDAEKERLGCRDSEQVLREAMWEALEESERV